ncbi:MAG: alternative ribosome rescue aminoacyl-tRNA hydrolase ArfB [Thermodesulfobacteriota bacterium]
MLRISKNIIIPDHEIEIRSIRAQGPGGQNVNKVASSIHLRFNITSSSLPDIIKQRLLATRDSRITKDGVVVIKAQSRRSRENNLADARQRLYEIVTGAMAVPKARRPSKPSRSAKRKRVDNKKKRGQVKSLRKKIS